MFRSLLPKSRKGKSSSQDSDKSPSTSSRKGKASAQESKQSPSTASRKKNAPAQESNQSPTASHTSNTPAQGSNQPPLISSHIESSSPHESNQPPSISSASSDLLAKHSQPAPPVTNLSPLNNLLPVKNLLPVTNLPSSGFFPGASNFDASHGVFTDASLRVAGDVHIRVETQDNAVDQSILNKLPRAKDATWRSGSHETCMEGTRTAELHWIEEWALDPTTKVICWLHGVAGSGKSTIAQTFAKRCYAKGTLGATFFCSRDSEDRRNIHLIFPTLAYYLALNSPEFRAALLPVISTGADICGDSLEVQLDELIIRPLLLANIRTTIIIDALDECEDRDSTSAILSVMARRIHEVPFVKFFVTGRPDPSIRSGFRLRSLRPHTAVFMLHEVDRDSVDRDIELYLRTHLSQIGMERGYGDSTKWPSKGEITAATKKCAGLFIIAYVIVKFVASRRHKPRERLNIITGPGSTIPGELGADATYRQVFLNSFDDIGSDDADFLRLLQIVIGCIVLAFNPLSCMCLAMILGITSEDVEIALDSLHSVFIVPDSKPEAIRICHKSLADYLTDATRCKDSRFYINPPVLHLELGLRCLRSMKKALKKNICDLPRYAINSDVKDLDARRERCIGGGLEYACRSWAKHLRLASKDGENVQSVVELLEDFFNHHLLQWLEVLSIVGDLRCAVYSIHDVTTWTDAVSCDASLLVIIKDSERFLLRFFDAIQSSAIHIYESAIPLSPSSSRIRALYEDQVWTDVKIHGVHDSWDGCIRAIQLQSQAHSLACDFSHTDDIIAVGEHDVVEIFEAATGQRRATLQINDHVQSLTFSPDDSILVTGCDSGIVSVWDLQTGCIVKALEGHSEGIYSVVFSPSGSMFATCSRDSTIRVWNMSTLDCKCVLEGHSGPVRDVCWSGAGGELISGSRDTTVKVWSVSGKRCTHTFTILTDAVFSVASSPGSSLIASGLQDGTIKVLNGKTGEVVHTISTNSRLLHRVRFLDRGKIMYATDSTFVIRDLTASVDVLTYKYEGWDPAISSDGTRLLTLQGDVVKIWQTDSASENDTTSHHTDEVECVLFSRDGELVASGSQDKTVKVWNTITGQCLTTFRGHSTGVDRVLFSPASTTRICASRGYSHSADRVIRIWDVHTGNQIATFGGDHFVHDMSFSPDGSQLASLGRPNLVKLWDVATGECLASMGVKSEFRKISFVDATSVVLRGDEVQRWRISSTLPDTTNLPMSFSPIHDTEPFIPFMVDPEHHYRHEGTWIMDMRDRRVLYVLPGWECYFRDTKVVFTSSTGMVMIVDLGL